MRPKYTDQYKREIGEFNTRSVTANGLDSDLQDLIAEVAKVDLVSSSTLAFEGLTRVLEDRFTDPDFIAIVQTTPDKYPLVISRLEARNESQDR